MPLHSLSFHKTQRLEIFLGFLCLLVYAGCFFFPLMDKDAAHHANIALYMYEHNDYVSLIDRGNDYLDKPHLLFWSSLASFKIFGINTFAHRFPAFLFALLSLFSTYRVAKHLTNSAIAKIATLILATAQAFILSINDARMETPLTAFIVFGLWQLIVYIDNRKLVHIVLAALGAALAFSTKGWLGPVVIFFSALLYIFLEKKWAVFGAGRTWLFIPLFFIFISPVLYAYYLQYDLHPEKIIRGESGRSGIRFILWDQLFERGKGFDVGGRHSGYFFLYHTFLWAFFPWSLFAILSILYWIRKFRNNRKSRHPLSFAFLSFLFFLVTISFSKFKMPHYIIMLLPLAALFTAPYLQVALHRKTPLKFFYPVQLFFALVVLVAGIWLCFYCFQPLNILVWIASLAFILALTAVLFWKTKRSLKTFFLAVGTSLLFNFLLNYIFFPNLLKYQAGSEMVKRMEKEHIEIAGSDIVLLEANSHSFDFYRGHNHPVVPIASFDSLYPALKDRYFLVSLFLRDYIHSRGYRTESIIAQRDYNVATVSTRFLNPATRDKKTDSLFLVKVYRP